MSTLGVLIKERFPNYKELAEGDYNRSYTNLWNRNMYQANPVFQDARQRLSNIGTRKQIIQLFKEKRLYDGYISTLVWGRIGLYQNGLITFNNAMNHPREDVESTLNRIRELLQENRLAEAYVSMQRGRENKIPGVAESFFTKLLYFIGESINSHIKPLIYDSTSKNILKAIYKTEHQTIQPTNNVRHYLSFIEKMTEISNELGLKTAGHLEAFLFNSGLNLIIDMDVFLTL